MSRVTRGFKARRRRNRVLKLAKDLEEVAVNFSELPPKQSIAPSLMPIEIDVPRNAISVVYGLPVSMPVPG